MKNNLLLLAAAGVGLFFLMNKGEAETSRSTTETIPYSDLTPQATMDTGQTYYTYNLGDVAFPQISLPAAMDVSRDANGNIPPALDSPALSSGTIRYGGVSDIVGTSKFAGSYDYGAANAQAKSYLTLSKQELMSIPVTGTRTVTGDFGAAVAKDFPQSVVYAPKKAPLPTTLMPPLMPILRP